MNFNPFDLILVFQSSCAFLDIFSPDADMLIGVLMNCRISLQYTYILILMFSSLLLVSPLFALHPCQFCVPTSLVSVLCIFSFVSDPVLHHTVHLTHFSRYQMIISVKFVTVICFFLSVSVRRVETTRFRKEGSLPRKLNT